MRLIHRSLGLTLLIALSLLSVTIAAAQSPTPGPDIPAGVNKALAAQGQARVLIALRDPLSAKAPVTDRAAAVARTQAAVQAAVPAGEIVTIKKRLEAVLSQ